MKEKRQKSKVMFHTNWTSIHLFSDSARIQGSVYDPRRTGANGSCQHYSGM